MQAKKSNIRKPQKKRQKSKKLSIIFGPLADTIAAEGDKYEISFGGMVRILCDEALRARGVK